MSQFKILIIEDEYLIAQSLKKLFERKGAEVTLASTGTDGLTQIRSQHFNRILCDLMLHDLTGFDLIEECKSFMSSQEIGQKFVIMTAYSSEQVLANAKTYGCPLLSKPFENIGTTINQIMQSHQD